MDDAIPMRTALGLSLADKPSLGQITRRLLACNDTTAAGQAEMRFLATEQALLDARLTTDINGMLIAEQDIPVEKQQVETFKNPRRGRADPLVQRAFEERDWRREEVRAAAATAAEVLRRAGDAMGSHGAEELAVAFASIERELLADTRAARTFIAARQSSFELEVEGEEPVSFETTAARTKVAASFTVMVQLAAESSPDSQDLRGLVLCREFGHVDVSQIAALPKDLFRLERPADLRLAKPATLDGLLLAAAAYLGLVVEAEVRPVVSSCTLAQKRGEVQRIANVDALLVAVLQFLTQEWAKRQPAKAV